MKQIKLLDESGILTEEAMLELANKGTSVSCECPDHLVKLLQSVKDFTKYQDDCLIAKPSDKMTHEWLKSTSLNLEHFISATIVNLARMEGMIDEKNQIID